MHLAASRHLQVVSVAVCGEHVAYSSSSGIVQVSCSAGAMALKQWKGATELLELYKLFEGLFQVN
jgi:hypothetical protein